MKRIGLAPFLAGAALLGLSACTGPVERQRSGVLMGGPGEDLCGFVLAPERPSPISDPCTTGSVVLPREIFPREAGAPRPESRTFTLIEPGAICVFVESHGVSSARILLNASVVIGPEELNPQVRQVTAFENLAAGVHELTVELASVPGGQIEVEVRFARTDVTLTGRVEGEKGKVAVGALAAFPDPFSPANHNGIKDVTSLSAMVEVLHSDGGPQFTYALHHVFEIADPVTCGQVRVLATHMPVDPAARLAGLPIAAEWDGRDEEGNLLPDGAYYFRSVVTLSRTNPGGVEQEVDTAVSLVRTIFTAGGPSVRTTGGPRGPAACELVQ